ncbi:uncharacterized protein isoform X1 [Leptinotarsa decemlineata]|uniref:uncharacterized protein isoform X1 n=2 Tax=Leptinotarsa decemlineata TaxID=7539 RepID=UPI003D30A30F
MIAFPHFHHCSWSLLKLTQFYKVFKFLSFFDENIFGTVKVMKISKIFLVIVLITNILTNIVISYSCQIVTDVQYLQCMNDFWQKNSPFGRLREPAERYIVGIYTAVNFMTQTGFEDITSASFEPSIVAIISVLLGFIVFAIFTAIVANIILEGSVETSESPEEVFTLMNIFDSKGLKNDVRRKCFRHFEYIWRYNGPPSHQMIKHYNPELDVNNTLFYFYRNILQDVPLFISFDDNFLGVLIDHIFVKLFIKGETVVKYKDILSEIFIVAKGEVDILNKNKEYMQTIGPTGVFGNISDNFNKLSGIYVVAKRNVEIWIFNTEKLLNIIDVYSAISDDLEHILKTKPNFILPIVSDEPDIQNELEADFDSAVKKSSLLLTKYEAIQFCLPQRWFKFSLEYDHGIFKVFDAMTAVASILNLLVIPYVFVTQEKFLLGYLYLLFEPIFYLRIFFKLHRSYVNVYGNLIQSNRKLRKKYINSPLQLFWDVVPNFPIGCMCFIFPREEWFFSYSCLRLLHILRFYYISQYFECNSDLHRKIWLLLTKLLVYYFFIIHILSCTWFMMACPFDNCISESWISRFEKHVLHTPVFYRMMLSYYYVLTVLTSTGIADIKSTNVLEVLFTSLVMIVGKIMLAVLLGYVLRTLHQSESRLLRYENESRNCTKFLKEWNVPDYQIGRTRLYMKNMWEYEKGRKPFKLLDLLPNPLKRDVLISIYGTLLRDTFLFKDIDEALLREVCTKLERKVYFKDDYIVKHGDVGSTMYFLYRGDVSVLTKDSFLSEIPHVILHPKDLFGVSQGLNCENVHTFFYRAASNEVEILTLKFEDWSYLLPLFPKEHRRILTRVEREYLNKL